MYAPTKLHLNQTTEWPTEDLLTNFTVQLLIQDVGSAYCIRVYRLWLKAEVNCKCKSINKELDFVNQQWVRFGYLKPINLQFDFKSTLG